MRRQSARTWVASVLMLLAPLVAQAQGPATPASADGISVFGTGEVPARPDSVEIDLTVSGKAELTGDALVKFRDAKQRLAEALKKLGLAELTLEDRGTTVSAGSSIEQQQRVINGIQQPLGKPQIEVSSTVRVTLKNVRQMPPEDLVKTVGKLIDVAQDAGVTIGPSAMDQMMRQRMGLLGGTSTTARFVVTDLAQLREQAYEKAVTDARERATRLAKLSGVKLGPALSVQEILVAGDAGQAPPSSGTNVQATLAYAMMNMLPPSAPAESSATPRISSSTLGDLPVQVKLLVRFGIVPAEPATVQK